MLAHNHLTMRFCIIILCFFAVTACRSAKVNVQAVTDTAESSVADASVKSVASDSVAASLQQSVSQQVDERIVSVTETFDTVGRVMQRTTTTVCRGSLVAVSTNGEIVSVAESADTISATRIAEQESTARFSETEKPVTARNNITLALVLALLLCILIIVCRIIGSR